MKKLFSILIVAVLCASVAVTSPDKCDIDECLTSYNTINQEWNEDNTDVSEEGQIAQPLEDHEGLPGGKDNM